MSLVELVNNARTDKNTTHSYLPLYQQLLQKKQWTARNVLEVGISQGGSIKLWADFFPKAHIYGMDILPYSQIWPAITNRPNITIMASTDAYSDKEDKPLNFFKSQNTKFDMILDDGPHTLESMLYMVRHYPEFLKEDGILIIEDVQDIEWFKKLSDATPDNLKQYIKCYDLRDVKKRYDDLVFTIDRCPRVN